MAISVSLKKINSMPVLFFHMHCCNLHVNDVVDLLETYKLNIYIVIYSYTHFSISLVVENQSFRQQESKCFPVLTVLKILHSHVNLFK